MINKQDFLNAFTQNIEMVRGDTLAFNFQLGGLRNLEDYEALNFFFVVAEHYNEETVIEIGNENGITLEEYNAEKDIATFCVCVAPGYTKDLPLIRYYYDLRASNQHNVLTLLRGRLTLLHDIEV